MSSHHHQTIVVELGSSRIKVGFAGEPKPRRVLHGDVCARSDDGSGVAWAVGINDGLGARPCVWNNYFRYVSSSSSSPLIATSHDWERTLHTLFSHIVTSVLFLSRPSRHRMIILLNELYPPILFRDALLKVTLDYLGVSAVWLVKNGGGCGSLNYLLDNGLSIRPKMPLGDSNSRPKAYLIADIGTHEARVFVTVSGGSSSSQLLAETYQVTLAGYHSFLCQVLNNYQEWEGKNDDTKSEGSDLEAFMSTNETETFWATTATLEDANEIVQAWITESSSFKSSATDESDSTTMSVHLPSYQEQQPSNPSNATIQKEVPLQPLLQAFRQLYLDYTNPSSLIYAMLTSVMASPIDYRKVALENVVLVGGGSVALRHCSKSGFGSELAKAACNACGVVGQSEKEDITIEKGEGEESEEKKEDDVISSIAKHRFLCLKGAIAGNGDNNDGQSSLPKGICIRYPDPFAADMVAWVGGSVIGSLGSKSADWIMGSGSVDGAGKKTPMKSAMRK